MTRIDLQDDSIQLTDLLIIKKLGSGMFGNVFLTMHKVKRTMYALKTVDRRKVEAYEIEENIVLERKILLQLDHMMIMKLVKTFKDSKRVYFLVEFIRGMDLFDVLRELNLLKECDARFYTGCISLILEHLHERNIIFRDLKPENVVIDAEGYPKLIDFGTAKFVNGRTYTIVGTPHYMAPEVITGHGYGLSADFWSLGVMVFEFLFGNVPFGEDESNPYTIYEKVQERRLVFPKWVDNKNKVKEFINQLLSKNPAVRTAGSIENFKANPWFIGFNWDKLASKDLKPPFTPQCNSLEADIENAVRNGKSLNEVITKIEEKETIPKTKRHSNYTENWDIDF
jgi:cGMP-dependent protein kinase